MGRALQGTSRGAGLSTVGSEGSYSGAAPQFHALNQVGGQGRGALRGRGCTRARLLPLSPCESPLPQHSGGRGFAGSAYWVESPSAPIVSGGGSRHTQVVARILRLASHLGLWVLRVSRCTGVGRVGGNECVMVLRSHYSVTTALVTSSPAGDQQRDPLSEVIHPLGTACSPPGVPARWGTQQELGMWPNQGPGGGRLGAVWGLKMEIHPPHPGTPRPQLVHIGT